ARLPDLERVGPEGNAVQAPAGGAPRGIRGGAAVADEVPIVADGEHVAHEALRRLDADLRVELEVTVLILGVDEPVVAAAAGADVAEHAGNDPALEGRAAEGPRVDGGAVRGVRDAVHHAVGEDPFIVDRRLPRLGATVGPGVE